MFYRKCDCTLCVCLGTCAGGCTCAWAPGVRLYRFSRVSPWTRSNLVGSKAQAPPDSGPTSAMGWCVDGQAQLFQSLGIQTQVFLFAKQSLLPLSKFSPAPLISTYPLPHHSWVVHLRDEQMTDTLYLRLVISRALFINKAQKQTLDRNVTSG